MNSEQELIENAFHQLQELLEGRVKWKLLSGDAAEESMDAKFELDGTMLYVEARVEVRPIHLSQFERLKQNLGELLVVSNYISPKAKDLLKEKGINYIDSNGNTFLRVGQTHVYIAGIPNPSPSAFIRTRLLGKAGIQVIFWLLQDPSNVNLGYRMLADRAKVALGNLPILFKALQEEGFLVKIDARQWALVNQERLLDHWVREFGRRLKPALFEARFQSTQQDFRHHWRDLQLQDGAVWGGEPGADLLADHLLPANFTLYSNAPKQEIMKAYRWVPNPAGNITVYRKFWKDMPLLDEKVHPLLVYADLNDAGEARGLEAAKMIFDQYLQRHA